MKKILIVSYSRYAAEFHKQTLECIFGNQFDIDCWLVSSHAKERVCADLVICVSGSMVDCIKVYLEPNTPIVTASYSLDRESIQRIKDISRTDRLSLVSYTRYRILKGRKALLGDMGIDTNMLDICNQQDFEGHLNKNVIYFGEKKPDELKDYNVIHIRSRMFSIGTITEIALALGVDFQKYFSGIQGYYQHISPFHGIVDYDAVDGNTRLDTISGQSDAIFKFSNTNDIYYCNEAAKQLLNRPVREYMDQSITELFPFLQGYSADDLENFGEQVVDFCGRLRVASIEIAKMHKTNVGTMYLSNYWEMQKRHDNLERQMHRKHHKAKYNFMQLIGNSEAMKKCREIGKRMSDSDENILIQGESGVGKELFAQAIHNASSRKKYPFVAINCGAMVDSLMESELFGYEEGAFTGAKKGGRQGYFEVANHGTLFLDEIGEMPLHLQTRLLRVLQEREIVRVGGNEVVPVDVRVIAATHQNLKQMIKNKTFRADLYYRICVLPLHIPSLSERREDIPLLVEYFKQKKNYEFVISDEAFQCLKFYNYEGNIRELENCLSYLSNLKKAIIEKADLPLDIQEVEPERVTVACNKAASMSVADRKCQVLKAIKVINDTGVGAGRRSIRDFLLQNNNMVSEAEIRKILNELQRDDMITIGIGRSGSHITVKGMLSIP